MLSDKNKAENGQMFAQNDTRRAGKSSIMFSTRVTLSDGALSFPHVIGVLGNLPPVIGL